MCYWKQTAYDNYRLLLANGQCIDFETYDALFNYCRLRGIDAVQA